MSSVIGLRRLAGTRRVAGAFLAGILVLLSVIGCEPEHNNGVMIQLTGRITNIEGEPLPATVTLFNAPGWFGDYQQVSQVQSSSTGQYEIAVRVLDCITMALEVSANGYHTERVTGISGPETQQLECTNTPQKVDVVLQASP